MDVGYNFCGDSDRTNNLLNYVGTLINIMSKPLCLLFHNWKNHHFRCIHSSLAHFLTTQFFSDHHRGGLHGFGKLQNTFFLIPVTNLSPHTPEILPYFNLYSDNFHSQQQQWHEFSYDTLHHSISRRGLHCLHRKHAPKIRGPQVPHEKTTFAWSMLCVIFAKTLLYPNPQKNKYFPSSYYWWWYLSISKSAQISFDRNQTPIQLTLMNIMSW